MNADLAARVDAASGGDNGYSRLIRDLWDAVCGGHGMIELMKVRQRAELGAQQARIAELEAEVLRWKEIFEERP